MNDFVQHWLAFRCIQFCFLLFQCDPLSLWICVGRIKPDHSLAEHSVPYTVWWCLVPVDNWRHLPTVYTSSTFLLFQGADRFSLRWCWSGDLVVNLDGFEAFWVRPKDVTSAAFILWAMTGNNKKQTSHTKCSLKYWFCSFAACAMLPWKQKMELRPSCIDDSELFSSFVWNSKT